jgi:formate hydrogenlyase subunit 3/multisubunit Na+/H+ antiporter MnhD subunit
LLGLVPVGAALSGGSAPALHLPWSLPFGSFSLEMDALSAVFVAPILIIAALAAVYGAEYLRPFERKKNLAVSWFFFNLLVGSMLLVVVARNAMLFLLTWEVMSLASFFLVMFESEQESVRRAGWTYLIATHIGTAFLLVMFALLGRHGGTLDFAGFSLEDTGSRLAAAVFLLAVIGFGTKAGFMPLHVWLPEAHPAAPSHVSAVMSGVMIKTGIYGLVRTLTFFGMPPYWWGWTLVGIGAVSGILGVLFALAQHDLKRLLAYHSVENIGIIALGLGVGLLGVSYGHPVMAFLGFAGGLLHVVNHAVFKSLLFLSAGSVLHASGTREIDHLGGLLKRMPTTAVAFLVGSVAICGLPPLNGFVSEFMIYVGSLSALAGASGVPVAGLGASLIVVASLALIGGLAVACFTKAFGVIFLGEPRSHHVDHAHEAGSAMRIPMAVLAIACLVIGLSGPLAIQLLAPAVESLTGGTMGVVMDTAWAVHTLWMITAVAVGILVLAALLALIRAHLLVGRPVTEAVTWDCGYAAPTVRMQYTASSFADPITRLFRAFLRTRRRFAPPTGLFPATSSFASDTPDVYRERMYRPAFSTVESVLARFRWLQHGRLNLYILYIVLALLVLLAWKLR